MKILLCMKNHIFEKNSKNKTSLLNNSLHYELLQPHETITWSIEVIIKVRYLDRPLLPNEGVNLTRKIADQFESCLE